MRGNGEMIGMDPTEKYLIAEIEEIIPYGVDDGKVFEQLVQIKTKAGNRIRLFDPMLHFMKSATRDMVGKKKKMIVFSSAEKIEKINEQPTRIIRVINKESGRPSDRLLMIAKIKKIFKKDDENYGSIIVNGGFGNIWLGIPEENLSDFNIDDVVEIETSHLELNNILN